MPGDLTSKPPLPALYWYHEFLAWAAHPAENGYVPVHPDTLRTVATILLEHHRCSVPPTSALPDDVEKAMQRLERTYAAVWLKHRESLFVAGNVNTKDLAIVFSYINTLRAPVTKSATVPVLPTSEEDERIVDAAIKRRLSGETEAPLTFETFFAKVRETGWNPSPRELATLLYEYEKEHCICSEFQGVNLRCPIHGTAESEEGSHVDQ